VRLRTGLQHTQSAAVAYKQGTAAAKQHRRGVYPLGRLSPPSPSDATLVQVFRQLVEMHRLRTEVVLPTADGSTVSFWDLYK